MMSSGKGLSPGVSPKAEWGTRRPIVKVQTKGNKPPFFFIAAGTGDTILFNYLSGFLGEDQPLYGLVPRGLEELPAPPQTLPDLAAIYAREVQSIQPHGPYYLGGNCLGGNLAFEIAHQLKEQGQDVNLVALFESRGPGYPKTKPGAPIFLVNLYRFIRFIQRHLDIIAAVEPNRKRTYLGVFGREFREQLGLNVRFLAKKSREDQTTPRDLNNQIVGDMRAKKTYTFSTYSGNVALFRASHQPLGILPDPYLGWRDVITNEIETTEVPGYHGSIFFGAQRARALAAELAALLAKARGG
jgi:thioesterase domain-containing protein